MDPREEFVPGLISPLALCFFRKSPLYVPSFAQEVVPMRWGGYDERLVARIAGAFRGRGTYVLVLLGLLVILGSAANKWR